MFPYRLCHSEVRSSYITAMPANFSTLPEELSACAAEGMEQEGLEDHLCVSSAYPTCANVARGAGGATRAVPAALWFPHAKGFNSGLLALCAVLPGKYRQKGSLLIILYIFNSMDILLSFWQS